MMPTPQQRRKLRDALINSFPSKSLIEQMLYFELGRSLNEITKDSDLQEIGFKLVQIAEAQGWLVDLVGAAQKENPGNLELNAIATELLTNNPTTTPYNSSKEDAIAKYRKKVEEFIADGEISYGESEILKDLQKKLKLTEEEVRTIRDEALEPFGRYRENLDTYRQIFTKWVDEQGYPLKEKAKADLKKVQEHYQLKDEDLSLLFKEAEQQEAEKLRQQPVPSDDLSSVRNVDYTKLRNLLKAGQWKEADEETLAVMLTVAGRENKGWLDIKDIPCTDLRTIDQLWVKYSSGRFGFSVQKQIYLEVGGLADGRLYREAWIKFGDRVGWRVKERWIGYSSVTFNTTAPEGHLPYYVKDSSGIWGNHSGGNKLFSRVETCKL